MLRNRIDVHPRLHQQLPFKQEKRLFTMSNHSFVQIWPDCLQHEGGDVILRFSQHRSGTLVLHSDILSRLSPYFAALFSKRKGWLEPKKTVQCEDGSSKLVYELDLVFDRMMRLGYFSGEVSRLNDVAQ